LTARTACERDDSSRNRLAKDEVREAAKEALRDFANTSIRYNKLMKEDDKRHYGIHTPAHPRPVQVPATSPRRSFQIPQ
jgi:hypothetical protein